MKNLIGAVLGAILMVGAVGAQPAQATPVCGMAGNGSTLTPWLVSTAADLAQVSPNAGCSTSTGSNKFRLINDIALSGSFSPQTLYSSSSEKPDFNGNGHTISGLTISSSSTDTIGLFSAFSDTAIHDLTITGASVAGHNFVGALVGQAAYSTISNIKVSLSGNVSGLQMVGGVVGSLNASTMSNVSFTAGGAVIGTSYCGGAIGVATNSTVNQISVMSNVTLSNIGGGVIGEVTPHSNISFDQLFYSGNMLADQYSGGLIGYIWSDTGPYTVTIRNSAVRGSVATVSGLYQPYAFIGQVNTSTGPNVAHISSAGITDSYSTAQFLSSGLVVSLANLSGGLSATATRVVFEPNSGSSFLTQGGLTSTTQLTTLPSGWNGVVETSGAAVLNSYDWVIDTSSSGARNGGRPMPAALYNMDLWQSACAPGYYSSNGYTPNCAPARAGHYVAVSGATEDIQCPAGSFQANSGSLYCILAPAGYFVSSLGSTAATPCPSGYESVVGAIACTRIATVTPGAATPPSVPIPTLAAPALKVTAGQLVTLHGSNVDLIKTILIASKSVIFTVSDEAVTFTVPADITLGAKDLLLKADAGSVVVQEALFIVPAPVTKPAFAPSVTFKKVGSKVYIYVSSMTPVSISLGKKLVAKNIVGFGLKRAVLLPKGKSTIVAKSAGVLLRSASYLVRK